MVKVKTMFFISVSLATMLFSEQLVEKSEGGGAEKISSYQTSHQDPRKIDLMTKTLTQINTEASMSSAPLEEQSKAISIIDKNKILSSVGTGDIQSLLAQVPGIAFSRAGGIGGQLVIRGFNTNDTRSIILIDGIRLYGRPVLDFNTLDPNAIESIEVLRGPASSLWGSDAMNGIINIKTRRFKGDIHAPFALDFNIRALDFASVNNYVGGRIELIGGGNGWDILIGASGKTADDYDTPMGVAKNSSFKAWGVDFNIGYTKASSMRFYAQGRYEDISSYSAGGKLSAPGLPFVNFSQRPIIEKYLRLGMEVSNLKIADHADFSVYVRRYDTDLYTIKHDASGKLIASLHSPVVENYIFGGRFLFDKKINNHFLAYGADFFVANWNQVLIKNNDTDKIILKNFRPSIFSNMGIFVKDDWNVFESWILSASLRGDYVLTTIDKKPHYDTEDKDLTGRTTALLDKYGTAHQGAITGSIGSVYFMSENYSFALNLSHNFKAPSTVDKQDSSLGTKPKIANPRLSPEYDEGAELSLRAHNDNNWASLTGYFNYYNNLIFSQLIKPEENLHQSQNIGEVIIAGLELEGRHNLFGKSIELSYSGTYTFGQNITNKTPMPYIPPLIGYITLQYNAKNWFIRFSERGYLGKQKGRIAQNVERVSKSYAMSDIYLGLKLDKLRLKNMQLVLGVENLFNQLGKNPVTEEDIRYPNSLIGNPLVEPGRNFVAKFAYLY